MKLLTPKFQRSEAIGARSPKPVIACVRLRPNRKSRPSQAKVAGYCRIDAALDSPIGDRNAYVGLTAEDWSRKRVAGHCEIKRLGAAMNVCVRFPLKFMLMLPSGTCFANATFPPAETCE